MQHFSVLCADSETKVCAGGGELIKAALHLSFRLSIEDTIFRKQSTKSLSFLLPSRGSLDLCSGILNQLSEDRPVRLHILVEQRGRFQTFFLCVHERLCLVQMLFSLVM